MRWISIVAFAALALAACGEAAKPVTVTGSEKAVSPPDHARGRQPPQRSRNGVVRIEAVSLNDQSASLSIRLLHDATDVSVHIYGTDGLVVLSDEFPISRHAGFAGDVLDLEVEYGAIGDEHRNLVVLVEGTFGGRQRSKVRSFTLGPALPDRVRALEATDVEGRSELIHRTRARRKR